MIEDLVQQLSRPIVLTRFSALDRLYRIKGPNAWSPYLHAAYHGSLVDLARDVPHLSFPGLPGVDAALGLGSTTVHLTVLDDESLESHPIDSLNLTYRYQENAFSDPRDSYLDLRKGHLTVQGSPLADARGSSAKSGAGPGVLAGLTSRQLLDLGVLLARYPVDPKQADLLLEQAEICRTEGRSWTFLEAGELRWLWGMVITGRWAHRGLRFLYRLGVLGELWPVLGAMDRTSHSKECHPEGNVWEHSLESLKHRKVFDLAFSTALFLHDCGKPSARRNKNRLFDGHAEIGASLAEDILQSMDYPREFIREVSWLIESHMIPGAIRSLPGYRTEPYLSNPWFPKLLELYRCDIASTWRDLGDYHTACAVYRSFLRYKKNPFRDSEGKKLLRLYVADT
ncbi:HD domain-containing protein [Spirochaeta lutea]|uniref:HD domain-containing protein n=1 Tax=Spirochaeta lutea TaxID=1480694 RepID=UPI00069246AD|nr:HD domain-containing protein [Spirochaeta lutea]